MPAASPPRTRRTRRASGRRGGRCWRPTGGDRGFTLLEMMIAVVIITVVMSALTSLFARSISTSSLLRAKQSATALATAALDEARSIGAVDAVLGRTKPAVDAQFTSFAGTPVGDWLTSMDRAYGDGSYAADLPTSPEDHVLGGTTFQVHYFVGTCHRQYSYTTDPLDCTNTPAQPGLSYVNFVRVVVAVTWPSAGCGGGTCYQISAVLVNGDDDPLFNLNEENPPPPVLHDCLDQVVMIGAPVEIAVFGKVQPNEAAPLCTLDGGVPPFTWSSTPLPQGLTLDPDGYVRGTPTGDAGSLTSQITITDVYGVAPSTGNEFGWVIEDPTPTITSPGDQRTRVGENFVLPMHYTCPVAGCTFALSDPTSVEAADPDGEPDWSLSIDSDGRIHGTAAATETTLRGLTATITAPSGTSATTDPFDWTFTDGLILPALGDQASSVGLPLSLAVAGDCGAHPDCEYALSGAPTGLVIDAASGVISGTPTAAGSYPVTVTLSAPGDLATASFTWTVYDGSSVGAIPDQQWTVGTAIDDIPVLVSCGWTPCTFPTDAATGLPDGVSFDRATGLISGTPTTPGSGTASISSVDGGGTASSTSFAWRVYATPSIADIGTMAWYRATGITTVTVSTSCDRSPCTLTGGGLPSGVSLNTSTGKISGTPTTVGAGTGTITITDAGGKTAATSFSWTVYALPTITTIGNQTNWKKNSSITSITVGYTCGNAPCAVSASGLPSGVTLSSGKISGKPTASGSGSATITVTDAGNKSASTTFSWKVK